MCFVVVARYDDDDDLLQNVCRATKSYSFPLIAIHFFLSLSVSLFLSFFLLYFVLLVLLGYCF